MALLPYSSKAKEVSFPLTQPSPFGEGFKERTFLGLPAIR